MNYTLRGKIAKAHPYQLDTTLTVEGAGAEAKATGKAINAVKKTTEDHTATKTNPHNVTKEQVGLGDVDNTPDAEKPVSTLQALAIADAKKAGTDAQTAADNAQASADNAHTAVTNALEYVDSKKKSFSCVLTANGWEGDKAPYKQTVNIEGILGTDRPHWGVVYSSEHSTQLLEKEAFALVDELDTEDGKAVFTCFEDKPANDLNIQMEVHR